MCTKESVCGRGVCWQLEGADLATLVRLEREKCAVLRVVQQWSAGGGQWATGFSAEVDVLRWVVGQKIVMDFGEGHKVLLLTLGDNIISARTRAAHMQLSALVSSRPCPACVPQVNKPTELWSVEFKAQPEPHLVHLKLGALTNDQKQQSRHSKNGACIHGSTESHSESDRTASALVSERAAWSRAR